MSKCANGDLKYANMNCGCVLQTKKDNKEQEKIKRKNRLVGEKFGKLTVVAPTEKRYHHEIVWECKCDCGGHKQVPTSMLQNGHTQSCGCLNRERRSIDITNRRFGKLVAKSIVENYPNRPKNTKTLYWLCECDCGNTCIVNGNSLRRHTTNSCGCLGNSIGEINVENILKKHNLPYKKEYVFKDFNNRRFDFALVNHLGIPYRLIEFDGEQHFESYKRKKPWGKIKFDSYEIIQSRDKEKNQYALSHNIPLVRIPYWERDNITLDMLLGDQYLVKE